jgi:hypothetical protein
MKFFRWVVLTALYVTGSVFNPALQTVVRAQQTDGDNLGEITFEELKDKEKSTQYFAVGGGFTGNFLMMDDAALNEKLPANFKVGSLKSPLFVSGGQGFLTFFFKNIRFGFNAGMGTQTTDTTVVSGADTIKQQLDYSASFNGVTIDYAIPVFSGFTILPGVQAGFGSMIFERYDGKSSDTWSGVVNNTPRTMSRLEISHLFVQPTVQFEYSLTTFTMIRANVGYAMTFQGDSWMLNRTTQLSGSPKELNSGGLTAGFGVFFGLFRNE